MHVFCVFVCFWRMAELCQRLVGFTTVLARRTRSSLCFLAEVGLSPPSENHKGSSTKGFPQRRYFERMAEVCRRRVAFTIVLARKMRSSLGRGDVSNFKWTNIGNPAWGLCQVGVREP